MSLSEMPECLMKLIRRKFFSHDLYFLQEIPHRYMSVSLIQVIVISAYWFYCLTTFASQNGDAVLEKHELIYRLALMAAPMPVILYLTYFAVNFLCRFLHFQTTLYDRSGEDSWMAVSELFSSLRERDGGMYGILGVRPTAESGQSAFVVRRIQKKYLFPAVVRTNLRNVPSFGDPDRTMYFILPDQLLLANDDYRFVAGIPWSDIRIVCEEKLMRDPLSGENMETPVPVSAIRLECGRWSTGLLIRGTDSNFIELGMLLLKMRDKHSEDYATPKFLMDEQRDEQKTDSKRQKRKAEPMEATSSEGSGAAPAPAPVPEKDLSEHEGILPGDEDELPGKDQLSDSGIVPGQGSGDDLSAGVPDDAGAAVSPDERPVGMKEETRHRTRSDDPSERREPSLGNLDITGESDQIRF